jgi:general secretion pathway protein E
VTRCIDAAYLQRRTPGEPSAVVTSAEESTPTAAESSRDLLRSADLAPVTMAVNQMILEALRQGASDVHIEPMERRLHVRFRLDGALYEQAPLPRALEAGIISRLKIMGRMDIAEKKRLPQDGMARVRVGEREIDIRVSTVPVGDGERLVLRLLRHDTALVPSAISAWAGEVLQRFRKLLREPNGVVWVTGPTGSGKTTTLYAALGEFDTNGINILTIEDPVEYQLAGIGQISVKDKIGLTFSLGLRHILRQDPDVILVGETRDTETAEIVVRASLTGHLVFSTLHTNDALGAVVRLIDMGVEPYLVAEAVLGALAQRLVRALCAECRRDRPLAADEITAPLRRAGFKAGDTVVEPVGCPRCRDGYAGVLACLSWLRPMPI